MLHLCSDDAGYVEEVLPLGERLSMNIRGVAAARRRGMELNPSGEAPCKDQGQFVYSNLEGAMFTDRRNGLLVRPEAEVRTPLAGEA